MKRVNYKKAMFNDLAVAYGKAQGLRLEAKRTGAWGDEAQTAWENASAAYYNGIRAAAGNNYCEARAALDNLTRNTAYLPQETA